MPAADQRVILSPAKDPSAPNAASRGSLAWPGMTGGRFTSLPARAVGGLVWVYQRTLSPALAALNPTCGCRFAPTCSHYAREALREHGLFAGLFLTLRRLAKCGPWHPGGEDPVPWADDRTTGPQDNPCTRRRPPACRSVRGPSSTIPPSLSHG